MPLPDAPSLHPRITWAALLICVAAGFALRVTNLDLAAFHADEAQLAHRATLAGALGPRTWGEYFHFFPRHGLLTSFGFHNPPLLIYLTAPFFALVRDPRFAMAGFALAGAIAIWLTALTAWRLWGARAAVVAGALVAFSPNAIGTRGRRRAARQGCMNRDLIVCRRRI